MADKPINLLDVLLANIVLAVVTGIVTAVITSLILLSFANSAMVSAAQGLQSLDVNCSLEPGAYISKISFGETVYYCNVVKRKDWQDATEPLTIKNPANPLG